MPAGVKKAIVPVWNAVHRAGWWVRDHALALATGNIERCTVCGRVRPMIYRRRVIPPRLEALWGLTPEQARALARKETSECTHCGAKLRARRLAQVLLELDPAGPSAPRSLHEWARSTAPTLRIAELNRIDGIHDQLAGLPNFRPSDYVAGAPRGTVVNGVRHEDATQLTYPDAAFDLVISSETLEHVPDLGQALAEIKRVLVPGGRHLFTIPRLPGISKTYPRASLRPDGTIEDLAPRIHHPGGDWGYLVYTEFGDDVLTLLEAAGFAAEERFGPPSAQDLAQVIVATRR